MSSPITRRELLRAGAAASASLLVVPGAAVRAYESEGDDE